MFRSTSHDVFSPGESVGQRLAERESGAKDYGTTGVPAFDYTKSSSLSTEKYAMDFITWMLTFSTFETLSFGEKSWWMVTGYGKQKTFHGHQRVFTYFAKRDTTKKKTKTKTQWDSNWICHVYFALITLGICCMHLASCVFLTVEPSHRLSV